MLADWTEMYAVPAIAGGVVYLAVRAMHGPVSMRIISGVTTTTMLRMVAWMYNARLPTW